MKSTINPGVTLFSEMVGEELEIMRTVLCYGDSNTHGQVPGGTPFDRFDLNERWPGILSKNLPDGWHIIEEGLSGRTTVRDDPIEGDIKNGRTYLRPCLMSHAPIDLVILMLGTNDLKARFSQPASEVAMGVGCLIHDIKELAPGPRGRIPEIMIVAPPPMKDDLKEWERIFAGGPKKSHELAYEFEIMADSLEVHFFDAGTVIESDPLDGFHLSAEAHARLGEALANEIEVIGWTNQHA